MGHRRAVNDLKEDPASGFVYRVAYLPPAFDLLISVDAGNVDAADRRRTDEGSACDAQSCAGTLDVVFGLDRDWHAARVGRSGACHGRHHEAVWEGKSAEPIRRQHVWLAHGIIPSCRRMTGDADLEPRGTCARSEEARPPWK